MTDESLTTDGPAQRPTGGGLAAAIAPEGVAAVLAIVVVAALLVSRLSLSGGGGAIAPSPSPSPTAEATATPSPGIDIAAIHLLEDVNGRLEDLAASLATELKTSPVNTSDLKGTLGQMAQLLNGTGVPAAERLESSPGGAELGRAIGDVYQTLLGQIKDADNVSLLSPKGWTANATQIAKTLALLPALDDRLRALLASAAAPSSGASPELSPSLTPSASPNSSPSVGPSTTPITPSPTAPSPTPSVAPSPSIQPSPSLGPSLLADGSFESGVGSPWQLVLSDQAAMGSVTSDPIDPHSPTAAARIDIASPSNRQIGISYQQGGFAVEAGAFYRVSIALRSTDVRDVRIRIADAADGQVLDSRLFTVNAQWTVETFDFSSFVGSGSAVFAVDVGRSAQSVWVDDVSLARVPPG